ncbi:MULTISPECIES: paraquat-inducible protein A [Pseudomonas]
MKYSPRATHLGVVACQLCGLVCESVPDQGKPTQCPRCRSRLHRRRPDSIARGWAFLLAGLIAYIPANVLPVMYSSLFGHGSESTILHGVVEFWDSGSYGIALIIFIASVVVPCSKFLLLGALLFTAQQRSHRAMLERARLYRLIELIGYWSMLDVMVVAVVAALVKFQTLSVIEPRAGIFFFGLMVILTMLSAMSFDPRLIWDGEQADASRA